MSNHADLETVAADFGVAFRHLPITGGQKRQHEASAMELLEQNDVELVVLARYMQMISSTFFASYANRIINIHHSFLPVFA